MNALLTHTQSALPTSARRQVGVSLIEVLIAAVILAIGLLGLASLQATMVASELDSYQRAHALVLLEDMIERVNSNRTAFATRFGTDTSPLTAGTGDNRELTDDCTTMTGVPAALCEWSQELKGASATLDGENVGAMIGARGCIERVGTGQPLRLQVSVAWQGLTATAAPDASLTCGFLNAFVADQENLRRVVTAPIVIPNLGPAN